MRIPFGALVEMIAAEMDKDITLGELAQKYDVTVERVMDAIDARKMLQAVVTGCPHGDMHYIEIQKYFG